MKIGVVSDTHGKFLPQQMIDDFKNVDFIIHAGDIGNIAEYKLFASMKEIKAVYGNMDDSDVCSKLPKRQIIACGKFRIGLFHGEGSSKNLFNRVKAEFKNDNVDVVVFGHSHKPFNEKIGNVFYFNPGSPTDKIFAPYCSYGILDVAEDGISGRIIRVEE